MARPDQLAHPAVHHDEDLGAHALHVFHPGQEHAGLTDDEAAGLEHEPEIQRADQRQDAAGEVLRTQPCLFTVGHAVAAAEVHELEPVAGPAERPDHVDHAG